MAELKLTVRSAKARELAQRLAQRENCSIANIVERALEAYEVRQAQREPAESFFRRIVEDYGTDVDLEEIIQAQRKVNAGLDL